MAKKVAITLFTIIIVAVAIVGIMLLNDKTDNKKSDPTESETKQTTYIKDYAQDDTDDIIEDETQVDATEEPTDSETDDSDSITASSFSFERVYDNEIAMDMQPRVVFGPEFVQSECYLKFDDSGNFEMRLSGYDSQVKYGTYTESNGIISVTYTDGNIAEYDIEYDETGAITSIVIPYNEYTIYFS